MCLLHFLLWYFCLFGCLELPTFSLVLPAACGERIYLINFIFFVHTCYITNPVSIPENFRWKQTKNKKQKKKENKCFQDTAQKENTPWCFIPICLNKTLEELQFSCFSQCPWYRALFSNSKHIFSSLLLSFTGWNAQRKFYSFYQEMIDLHMIVQADL